MSIGGFCKFTIARDFRSSHRKCLEGNFVLSLARSTVSSIPASMQVLLAALAGSCFYRLQLWGSINICLLLRKICACARAPQEIFNLAFARQDTLKDSWIS